MNSRESMIGKAVERIEDLRFLRGKGTFSDDVHLDGELHAVILRSPVAHGNIRALDVAEALAIPGVHAVITAAEIGRPVPRVPIRLFPVPEVLPFKSPVIADAKVRFVGEPIAIVLATSPAIAEDGRDAIGLVIEQITCCCRAPSRPSRSFLSLRRTWLKHRYRIHRYSGRCRRGIRRRRLYTPRNLLCAATHRRAHGASWTACRVERWPHGGPGRGIGAICQPKNSGAAYAASGNSHRHDRA